MTTFTLLDEEIINTYISSGIISVNTQDEEKKIKINPFSITLFLSEEFMIPNYGALQSMSVENPYVSVEVKSKNIIVNPHQWLIVQSKESIKISDNIIARTLPFLQLNLYGIFCTPNEVKVGTEFRPTFTLYNANPIPMILKSGMELGSIEFYSFTCRKKKIEPMLVKIESQKDKLKEEKKES